MFHVHYKSQTRKINQDGLNIVSRFLLLSERKNVSFKNINNGESCYPQDGNGSIENEELGGFLKDLLELVKRVIVLYTKAYS